MAKKEDNTLGITVKKADDMPEWYSEVVVKAELADYAPIKGFMIIRPQAYAMWESIQDYFNGRMRKLGVKNAYFPLLIPESFFKKEAQHAEGFAPELAWVEQKDEDGERVAIRPTSETIMYDSYSKWIRSYRDLPLRINQWCNVLRWEVKQTKPFLRTREFLWQEGHNVYETQEEAAKEVEVIIKEYQKLVEELLAIPVLVGKKTQAETFAGADYTLTIEAFMPDGKALQCGTSHMLGQGFSKAFGISFLGRDEKRQVPWQISWGFSTRLIGAIVMVHGDDKGLVIPPKVADNQVVIVPIIFGKGKELEEGKKLQKELSQFNPIYDDRDEYSSGWKFNEWELKGIPLRVEIGPKDIEKKQIVVVRRDTGEKIVVPRKDAAKKVKDILDQMQKDMFAKAKQQLDDAIVEVKSWEEFEKAIKDKKLAKLDWCNTVECEEQIKDKTGATSRCMEKAKVSGTCLHCGKENKVRIYFSKSY